MTNVLLTSVLFVLTTSCLAADDHAAPPEPEGMTSIFNGKDLSGWDGDERLWSVRDGVIHGETTDDVRANGNTFLIWKDGKTTDFELRLSFRLNATNNSGIQYRSRHITEGAKLRNKWILRGYQHEIRNQNILPNVSGFIYDEGGRRGRIILVGQKGEWQGNKLQVDPTPLISADEYQKLFKLDDWNDVVIIAKGNHIRHYTNGRLVMDFKDSEERALKTGNLGLQLHAGKPMWAEYRDIRFKDLSE